MTAWLTIIEAGHVYPTIRLYAGNKAAIALAGLLARNNKTKCVTLDLTAQI